MASSEAMWPVEKFIPYARNPRDNEATVIGLVSAIKEFGFRVPMLVKSDGLVVDGHARLEAAKRLGIKELPIMLCDDLSDVKIKALRLNINRMAELAKWDMDLLKIEIEELDNLQFDVELLNFDNLDEILKLDGEGTEGNTDPDAIPEIDDNPYNVERGQVWVLGEHRVMCGDSTDKADVEKLMGGEKADMVFTDPPYNLASYSKNYAKNTSKAMKDLSESEWDKNFNIVPALDRIKESCSENCTIYIWTSQFLIQKIWDHLNRWCGFTNYGVWNKPNPMPSLSKRHWTWNTELCVYGSIGTKRAVNFPNEGHALSTWTVFKKLDGSHPTQKPIELIEPIVEFSSNRGQTVLDLFLGSGSTLIACEKTNRKCYGMEIDLHYCSVILKRWEDFTGKRAELCDA